MKIGELVGLGFLVDCGLLSGEDGQSTPRSSSEEHGGGMELL